jgi:hypothetical protein
LIEKFRADADFYDRGGEPDKAIAYRRCADELEADFTQQPAGEAVAWRKPTPYGVAYNFASEEIMRDIAAYVRESFTTPADSAPLSAKIAPLALSAIGMAKMALMQNDAGKAMEALNKFSDDVDALEEARTALAAGGHMSRPRQ